MQDVLNFWSQEVRNSIAHAIGICLLIAMVNNMAISLNKEKQERCTILNNFLVEINQTLR